MAAFTARRWLGALVIMSTGLAAPISAAEVAPITLPPLSKTERGWVADPASIPSAARLGFGRAIPDDALPAALTDPARWQTRPDGGRRLALSITSPRALGLRLGLAVGVLPAQASLRVFSADTVDLAPISGAEISVSLAHDRAALAEAGERPAEASLFWTPLVLGDTLSLELTLPAGVELEALAIRLDRVSHLFRLPFTLAGEADDLADDCHLDLACSDDPLLERLARATAILLYTLPDGGSSACSGVLLADSDPETRIPYLVTAHHCIPDQIRASSLETYWGHRAEDCGERPNREPVRVTGGADLLNARKTLDTALVRLRADPPPAAVFADWSATLPEPDTEILSVHDPLGRTAKVARGRLSHYWHCEEVAYCGEDAEPDGIHYFGVTWAEGLTSGGSSGAGAFRADTGELVGLLTGGLSGCKEPEGPDDFGRFDWAYRDGLWRWLGPL
ncbi:MAG: hypothetical protein GVY22_15230 [Gammaproteobacteria bacterium]|jgi:hypothetical protein|nr:hypothetical protein [Gammaproteobacteria bacterium]